MLLDKILKRGKYKRNVYETDFETISYKHKGKRIKYYDIEYSLEVNVRYKYTSESSESDRKPRKGKYKPYE